MCPLSPRRADEIEGIARLAVEADFEMEMRSHADAGRADLADQLLLRYGITFFHFAGIEVVIAAMMAPVWTSLYPFDLR